MNINENIKFLTNLKSTNNVSLQTILNSKQTIINILSLLIRSNIYESFKITYVLKNNEKHSIIVSIAEICRMLEYINNPNLKSIDVITHLKFKNEEQYMKDLIKLSEHIKKYTKIHVDILESSLKFIKDIPRIIKINVRIFKEKMIDVEGNDNEYPKIIKITNNIVQIPKILKILINEQYIKHDGEWIIKYLIKLNNKKITKTMIINKYGINGILRRIKDNTIGGIYEEFLKDFNNIKIIKINQYK